MPAGVVGGDVGVWTWVGWLLPLLLVAGGLAARWRWTWLAGRFDWPPVTPVELADEVDRRWLVPLAATLLIAPLLPLGALVWVPIGQLVGLSGRLRTGWQRAARLRGALLAAVLLGLLLAASLPAPAVIEPAGCGDPDEVETTGWPPTRSSTWVILVDADCGGTAAVVTVSAKRLPGTPAPLGAVPAAVALAAATGADEARLDASIATYLDGFGGLADPDRWSLRALDELEVRDYDGQPVHVERREVLFDGRPTLEVLLAYHVDWGGELHTLSVVRPRSTPDPWATTLVADWAAN